ncbi:hypothetical protein BGW36DRAFT_380090 [Talaromyces proteolyticus]|uniref:holo-[acyl-carrier-protein] synthase n=1 Tax=Talaromyces proteolyticus TaxID=1131652 RepID=A0AAD4KSZ4_9EURO|nr:uncharacterized protein BGW36DRAFT_380090 [Talaromyces proteolyticus]KAH8696026.1 hypothetical protein BGW36DRAFT_380090 [Talaromyces proteolyticus]
MANPDKPSLTRWYIDTRQLSETTTNLPLLETLQPDDQTSVQKFLRLPDRHMSLASNLLKYLFIHRTCRIPWTQVIISRTPKPHQRPCYIPSTQTRPDGGLIPAVEFNVSHQASFVALAGCRTSSSTTTSQTAVSEKTPATQAALFASPLPASSPIPSIPQVGIDITCVDEPGRRRNKTPTTANELAEFVDIFKEVFSPREISSMKQIPISSKPLHDRIKSNLRLFYAYWALKEAYIKMTGEALLAPWLQELEFTNVVPPAPVGPDSASPWSEPYRGVETWFYGRKVEDVRIELVAFENDYLVATAARGGEFGAEGVLKQSDDSWGVLEQVDLERDVRPCATGNCQCLG